MKNHTSNLLAVYVFARRARNTMTTLLAGTFVLAQVTPTLATIDNTANATGTYNAATANYGASSKSVPVAAAAPSMTITKSAGSPTTALGADTTNTDALDTITFTYVVTNTGNVTMNNVVPIDAGPSFGGIAGTNTLGAYSPATASIAPTFSQTFTATYVLSTLDVYHGAGLPASNLVTNSAVALGNYGPSNASTYQILPANKANATTTIVGFPSLSIVKTFALADKAGGTALFADVGETITYTYRITNNGTVPMTNVSPRDLHDTNPGPGALVGLGGANITSETVLAADVGPLGAAASTDATANNGIWSTLAPGASVTFTWAHVVTQAEFNHG